jgi:ferric uptake regulator family protein
MKASFIFQTGDPMARPPPDPATTRRDAEPRHALVCTRCGDVVEIDTAGLEPLRESVARRLGFEVIAQRLQVFGCCAACRRFRGGAPIQRWGRA